jgi:hypothetical protein
MKKIFIYTCLLLFGCKQVSKEPATSETINGNAFERKITIDNIDENTVLKYSDIYDSIQFVRLETRDDNLIGRIDKMIVTDDKFFILDIAIARKVFVFDISGKFLNIIGSNGEGPEEYDSPNDIAYDEYNDELLVLCHNKKSIMKFKPDGTFVKNIKIDWWATSIHVADKNSYLVYLNNNTQKGGKINDYNIQIIDDNGMLISQLLPYDKERIALSPPSKKVFSTFQKELLFSPYYTNMTFKIDMDSIKIRNKYYFDFGKHSIPQSLFSPEVTSKEFYRTVHKDSHYALNILFAETSSHISTLFVYDRKIYTCIHSKESGITKFSSVFLNDINSLYAGGIFCTQKGNALIGYVEPEGFLELQSLLKGITKISDNIGDIYLDKLKSNLFGGNSKLKDNLSKAINSTKFTVSEDEINFINSIEETDNPIIQIATLKKF